ncbi:MAG: endonuclease III [Chloroflexi bacterium]|nr:endonuclease III [Chloroflexota bacterium]
MKLLSGGERAAFPVYALRLEGTTNSPLASAAPWGENGAEVATTRSTPKTLSPKEIVERLSVLYGEPVWRPHGDAMTELVLTVLSQNTSDANSGRAFMRLRSRFPTWEQLMAADPVEIAAEIQVGGLGRIKAPRIKAVLEEVCRRVNSFDLSFLGEMPLADAKEWLRSLPGVGPKTAACVLMFALGRPALPVDTHVHRVSQRLGLAPAKAGAAQAHDLLEALLEPEEVYPFHVSLIKHGRRLCRAQRPRCPDCPLRDRCPTAPLYLATDV